jgi:hypothetical protein
LFIHKKIHKGTWRTPGGNAINQTHHIMIDARHKSNLLDVRAFRGANLDSGHHMIGSKIRARIARSKLEKRMRMEKFNVDLLQNGSTAKQYAERVGGLLGQSSTGITDTSDVNDDWKFLRTCTISAADEVIGKIPQGERKAWFDEECQEITRKKNEIYKQIQQRRTRAREEEYEHLRRAEKRVHQRKKRVFYNEEMKELESAGREKAVRLLYQKVNSTGQNFKPRTTICKCKEGRLISDKEGVLRS